MNIHTCFSFILDEDKVHIQCTVCFLIYVLFPFCVLVKYKYSHVPVNLYNLSVNFVSVHLTNTMDVLI